MSIAQRAIQPLRAGQRLTVQEFLRRWEAMPELKYDMGRLLHTLQRGLRSAEHAAFVKKLAARKN